MKVGLILGAALAVLTTSALPADAQVRSRFKLEQVQGILAVQNVGGWLLYDNRRSNPVATELVNPDGKTARRWFYLIPASGQPRALVHKTELSKFQNVPGTKKTYTSYRSLLNGLRGMLKGVKTVAMEYAPKSSIPSLSRVDAATVRMVRGRGVQIRSSAQLVQFTKSLWGPKGRIAHYIAAHHLEMLAKQALTFVADKVKAGKAVTEIDVQNMLVQGYKVRGIVGPPPRVAAGVNTAVPRYAPKAGTTKIIKRGDLLMLSLSAKVESGARPIFADFTWMAYVGDSVPDKVAKAFEVVAKARDAALELIKNRKQRRRPVKGFEVDRAARAVIGKAGWAGNFPHRTGHSLDTSVHGDGANLDSFETVDKRVLVLGSGFTIEPGVYFKGQMGVRAEINVFIGRAGVEVTTPAQKSILAILK